MQAAVGDKNSSNPADRAIITHNNPICQNPQTVVKLLPTRIILVEVTCGSYMQAPERCSFKAPESSVQALGTSEQRIVYNVMVKELVICIHACMVWVGVRACSVWS